MASALSRAILNASSRYSNGCKLGRAIPGTVSAWPFAARSSSGTVAGSGSNRSQAMEQHFSSLFPALQVRNWRRLRMSPIQVLLVEDNPGDARLAREALADSKLRLEVIEAHDGEAA